MTPERYNHLIETLEEPTPEETAEGWHFCVDWDFLLVGPGMSEQQSCVCFPDFAEFSGVKSFRITV